MNTYFHNQPQTKTTLQTEPPNPMTCIDVTQAGCMPSGIKNPHWMGFPSRLLSVRMGADMSMVTLATMCGVTHGVIANAENHKSVPRLDTVERMAYALGVSPTWFAFGHDGDEPFVERNRRSPLQIPKDPRPGAPLPCPESYKGMPERIQAARQKAGLSLRGLADACGLSGPGVKKIEVGASVPTIDNVEAIAKALGVSPGWLAFGIGRGPDGKKARARAVA